MSDAWRHCVDANLVGGKLTCERLRQSVYCELGCGIGAAGRLTIDANHRARVDDGAAALGAHERRNCLAAIEHGINVECHGFIECGGVVVVNGFAGGNTSVVTKDVDAAEGFVHLRELCGDGIGIRHIGPDAHYLIVGVDCFQLFNGCACRSFARAAQSHLGSVVQKCLNNSESDTACTASNDCGFSLEQFHVILLGAEWVHLHSFIQVEKGKVNLERAEELHGCRLVIRFENNCVAGCLFGRLTPFATALIACLSGSALAAQAGCQIDAAFAAYAYRQPPGWRSPCRACLPPDWRRQLQSDAVGQS